MRKFTLFLVLLGFNLALLVEAQSCDADGLSGTCIDTDSSNCGGQLIPGYCPGGSNIVCCVSMPGCSTPQGSGTCSLTSACSGNSVPGYCPGPSDVECCISGSGQACSTPQGSGICELTSQCSGTSVPGYCPGPSDVECCVSGGGGCDVSKVVQFADSQWDCADPSCSSRVPAGSSQPGYACAEFAARALAYGGCIPIDPYGSQSDYSNFQYGDLLLTTGLGAALDKLGFARMGTDGSSVNAGCAVVGDGGDGAWSHAAIGVSSGTVDAHNNARYHMGATWVMDDGIDEIWCP